MGKRRLKLHELRSVLSRYEVQEDRARGKGGHTMFFKKFPEGIFSHPVPGERDVQDCYVKGCRKRFRLMPEDGVSDDEFFGKK